VRTACAYTDREEDRPCEALLLVTARLPEDGLATELERVLAGRDGPSVRVIGDAWSPGTIAAAVWDGRRYAEELDEPPSSRDAPPFLREVVALAPLAARAG
jgi:dimethylamine/trimethylamine dehydrogenase